MSDALDDLQESLVYKMSLGSRELFHSNIWAWLIDKDKNFAKCFFDDIDVNQIILVRREEKNRDISIHLKDGKVYIIENKLKSIPTIEQLKKYADNEPNFKEGLLTGLLKPSILDKLNSIQWKFKTYREIGESIKKYLDQSNENTFKENTKNILNQYCTDLKNLNEIISLKQAEFNKVGLINDKDKNKLDSLGLVDLMNKLNADNFIKYFSEKLKEDKNVANQLFFNLSDTEQFKVYSSFSNKQNIIDFRFYNCYFGKLEDKDNKHFLIGIQIEGNQYRRCAEIQDKQINDCESVFEEFKKDFFDEHFKPNGKKEIEFLCNGKFYKYTTSQTKFFCKYQGTYKFVYQYFNLDSLGDNSYDTVYELLIKDLLHIRKIFDRKRKEYKYYDFR